MVDAVLVCLTSVLTVHAQRYFTRLKRMQFVLVMSLAMKNDIKNYEA